MPLVDLKLDPTRRELAWFGALFAVFVAVAGGLARWRFDTPATGAVIWAAGAALALAFALVPPFRRPLYVAWMCAAYPIGWVVSHVVLAIVYYVALTGTGWVMRLLGHDPMQRRFEPEAKTYWIEHRPSQDHARYFRQF